MKIEIKSCLTGAVLFEGDFSCIAECVKSALKSGADLYRADLRGADLSGANLSRANLSGADLSGADLSGADLYGANLSGADLYGANLRGANLSRADLSRADLYRADLRGADLSGANLYGANLYGANLYGADLSKENAAKLYSVRTILPEGELVGYKKLANGIICKLRIPAGAKRVGGLLGRKCRAEYAEVIEGYGKSSYDPLFVYKPGATIKPKEKFNDDVREECTSGIHFFITRQEAEDYSL